MINAKDKYDIEEINMEGVNENYLILKQKIQKKYDGLFLISKLLNDKKFIFGQDYLKFNIIDIYMSDEEELYMLMPEISIFIESVDIEIQEWLESQNIIFTVRNNDISISFETYNKDTEKFLFRLFDFIKLYENNI